MKTIFSLITLLVLCSVSVRSQELSELALPPNGNTEGGGIVMDRTGAGLDHLP